MADLDTHSALYWPIQEKIDRRTALTALATALGAPSLLAGCFPLKRELVQFEPFVGAIAEATIPGADHPDVVRWIIAAAQAGLFETSLPSLERLETILNRRVSGNYVGRTSERRVATLRELDAEVYAGKLPNCGWGPFKTLILAGYYTSEIGTSDELHYELSPGIFKADVPVTDYPVPLSNDWTAVAMRQKAPA